MAKDTVIESGGIFREQPGSGYALASMGYSPFIFIAVVIMAVAVLYVWSHDYMTALEYRVASEISKKVILQEQQRKLRVELATLKSPKRISSIAMQKLQMIYPERKQVVFLKDPGHTK